MAGSTPSELDPVLYYVNYHVFPNLRALVGFRHDFCEFF
jgi:hypothetical protein